MDRMRQVAMMAAALAAILSASGCSPTTPFQATGTLVQGAECVLFQADSGVQYGIANTGSFRVGSRVAVQGLLDPNCASICSAGRGCILDNIIGPANNSQFTACGVLVAGVECTLFQTDDGTLYVVQDLSGFQVGASVIVSGLLNTGCATTCQQGAGCIENNTIQPCLQ